MSLHDSKCVMLVCTHYKLLEESNITTVDHQYSITLPMTRTKMDKKYTFIWLYRLFFTWYWLSQAPGKIYIIKWLVKIALHKLIYDWTFYWNITLCNNDINCRYYIEIYIICNIKYILTESIKQNQSKYWDRWNIEYKIWYIWGRW